MEHDLLHNKLSAMSEQLKGQKSMQILFKSALNWCEENNKAVASQSGITITKSARSGKHKTKKSKFKAREDPTTEKKAPMKTGNDVINRILWDADLPSENFTIGYMDRFTGIVEKSFTAFSWEDISSVDYDVLSIPKHRIEYFKYKTLKFWDKSQRLDNMFGSTGGKAIMEVIEQCDIGPEGRVDMGIEVRDDVGASALWDRQRSDDCTRSIKVRPNYFICLHITNAEVKSNIRDIQQSIQAHHPSYKDWCISVQALHITLCRLHLGTHEQIADACSALRSNRDQLATQAQESVELVFEKIDTCFNRVLYAQVHHGDSFFKFVETLGHILSSSGLHVYEEHAFVPHLTILKSPKHQVPGQARNIDPLIYEDHITKYVGRQSIDAIHLCSMLEEKREDGFYATPLSLQLE